MNKPIEMFTRLKYKGLFKNIEILVMHCLLACVTPVITKLVNYDVIAYLIYFQVVYVSK